MNSSWINTADVIIGNNGAGTLSVEDGGQVSNTFGTMAKEAGSKAAVTVTGNDSAWINSDTLYIGLRGTGALSVEDGGYVSNATGLSQWRGAAPHGTTTLYMLAQTERARCR